jgi:hypothetical protein
MDALVFTFQFLTGISLIGSMLWILYYFSNNKPLIGAILFTFILALSIAFSPCISAVFIVLGAILQLLWNFIVSPFGYGVINSWPFVSLVLQILLPLLPLVFLAIWLKNRFFPTFNFRTLFELDDQQSSSNSSYNAPSNGSNQAAPEEISTSNSMPVFLRKRAQRLGLTSASAPVPIPTPGSSSHPANSANGQPTVSSQSAPVEPVDPTLLPPSEDVPGQTVYRRIIPIKP